MTVTELREIGAGKFVAGFSDGSEMKMSLDVVADLSLFRGRELTQAEFETLGALAGLSACKEQALRIIGARPMSQKALYDRLIEKGQTPENAEETVGWLVKMHYLNDAQYAASIVRHYATKGYGVQKIRQELYRRGIPKALWDEALDEKPQDEDAVYALLCKKLKSDAPDRAELKRATDALFRRGFSWDEIRAAVSRFNAEGFGD